jgi:hypothetical protein
MYGVSLNGAMTSNSGSSVIVTFVSARDMGSEAAKFWRKICKGDRSSGGGASVSDELSKTAVSAVSALVTDTPFGVPCVPLIPFACTTSCPFASGVDPRALPNECRELERTGVRGLSAFRFCGNTDGGRDGGPGTEEKSSEEAMTRSVAETSRSGWNSWYGRSSRGLMLDRGAAPRKWPVSSRAKDPGRRLLRPGRRLVWRGAMAKRAEMGESARERPLKEFLGRGTLVVGLGRLWK